MTVSMELKAALDQVKSLTGDMAAMQTALVETKADLAAAQAAHGQAIAKLQADLAVESAKLVDTAKAQVALTEELSAKAKALAEAEGKLKLSPFADVSNGGKAVPETGAAGDGAQSDWIAEVESKHGAEKMKFYRENKEKIDAAYEKRASK